MGKVIQREEGFTLVVVLMVLVVLSVLTTAIMGITLNNAKMTRGEQDDQATYYIAEAGINSTRVEIEKISKEVKAQVKSMGNPELSFYTMMSGRLNELAQQNINLNFEFEPVLGKMPKVTKVTIEKGNGTNDYIIESTGWINDKNRTLKGFMTINFKSSDGEDQNDSVDPANPPGGTDLSGPVISGVPEGTAVFVKENITMTEGAGVNGNIGTNKFGNNIINLSGGANVSGGVYVPVGSENGAVKTTEGIKIAAPSGMSKAGIMTLPEFPEYPYYNVPQDIEIVEDPWNKTSVILNGNLNVSNWISDNYVLKMTENISLNNMTVSGYTSMTIDVGDTDKVIVVSNLNVAGHIKIIGKGNLTFLVKDQINFTGGSINKDGPVDKLGFFLQSSSDTQNPKNVTMGSDLKIFGSLYAEDANITVTSGGGFQGNIFTGGNNVTISGGGSATSSLILAPNADVKLTGGGNVKGAIYANSLYADGGTIVNYAKPTIPTGPFLPDSGTPPLEGNGGSDADGTTGNHTKLIKVTEV